jgi:hypothetical protein
MITLNMKNSKLIICSIFFLLLIGSRNIAIAQCAQCVATVESNRQAGNDGLAKGLNKPVPNVFPVRSLLRHQQHDVVCVSPAGLLYPVRHPIILIEPRV